MPANFQIRDLWLTLALGAAGFAVNVIELQLGWGLHFMFGNALVFAFIRILRPQWLLLAASISSLRSVFLWNHPWAWLIWTIETAFVAYSANRNASPVRASVLFWLLIGTPLLVIFYGVVMNMDKLSLLLVITKQAANGVLNVVIGEIIYLLLLSLKAPGMVGHWPKMPIESFLMTLLLAIILIPTTAYLYIDAPDREQAARDSVDDALKERLKITGSTVGMWAHSRALALSMLVERNLAIGMMAPRDLPDSLKPEFMEVSVIAKGGAVLWASGSNSISRRTSQKLAAGYVGQQSPVLLAAIAGGNASSPPQLALVTSFAASAAETPAVIIATVRPKTLQNLLSDTSEDAVEGAFLAHSVAGILPLTPTSPVATQHVRNLPLTLRASALNKAILVSNVAYGNALMSDLRDARMVRTSRIAGLPDWEVVSIASLAPKVLEAREGQLQLFTALCIFVLLVTLLASVLSRRTANSLRQLALSAADLAALGTGRAKIDSLVIAELNEISGQIASAGSTVSRERGAQARYQLRLNSIARHAPIIVYALDVQGHAKGELAYVSEALETILGYTRDEAAAPGWWSHAIHPEDYDHCIAVFGNLQAGRVVRAEYRLRHKSGHYVWVYDTLSVEAGATSGHCEAIGVLIDISERKAATEQLIQADKMASLGRMISGTAHELNQPLNFIKLAALNLREHVRRGRIEADRITEKLDRILLHVNRASAIILQMRIFGRTPKEAPFAMDVKTAIDAVLTMVASQLEFDGTRIETTKCVSDVRVRAHPVLLEQVVLNLIINANDAIRARRQVADPAPGCISVGLARHGWLARITVEDNGIGLDTEILPVIFEPFFTTKNPKDGTGLGLSISYGIIRDLGGSIRAENTGSGARFIIELPLSD